MLSKCQSRSVMLLASTAVQILFLFFLKEESLDWSVNETRLSERLYWFHIIDTIFLSSIIETSDDDIGE